MVVRAQGILDSLLTIGAFSTYRLIGITEVATLQVPEPIKENGFNDKGSLLVSKVPPAQVIEAVSPTEIGTTPVKSSPTSKKSRCSIM
jgi:hypothetical protein